MPLTREQVEARRLGVGGSDVAAILGLNPWASAYDVYLDKLGQHPNPIDDDDPPEVIAWGNLLEPVIADEVSRRRGVELLQPHATAVHLDNEWMRVNVDRLIIQLSGDDVGVLEIKTTNAYQAQQWKAEEAPAPAVAQLCWAYAVTGYKWGWAAGLVGGQRLLIRDVPYDQDLIDRIVQRCGEFWHEHVLPRIPPPVVSRDRDLLKALYAVGGQGPIEADDLLRELAEGYVEARTQESFHRKRKQMFEAQIRQHMGDHDIALDGEQPVVRLSYVKGYEVPAHTRSPHRRLYV